MVASLGLAPTALAPLGLAPLGLASAALALLVVREPPGEAARSLRAASG
jgi:hypothetical protein